MAKNDIQIDALILCGGLGTRLRRVVSNKQKCMAQIGGRPFLDLLITYLKAYNIKRIILSLGYKAGTVKNYYIRKIKNGDIVFCEEKKPLGTAGAIKNAERLIESNPFLVLNGDSLCRLDLYDFLFFHKSKNAHLTLALIRTKKKNTKDFGVARLNKSRQIISFSEKTKCNTGFINAGIYLFQKEILSLIPKGKIYSLERDLFPKLKKGFYGYLVKNTLIDIGTPRRYKEAVKVLQ